MLSSDDEVVTRFCEATDPSLFREQVAQALYDRVLILGKADPAAEIATYDELVRRFAASSHPTIRQHVVRGARQQGHHAGRN